jgi:hypothetical protein
MAQVLSGQVAITLIIHHRQVVDIVDPVNTTIENCSDQEKDQYRQSSYGLREVETIYETDTQSANTCYIVIGNKKVPVPCN